jgi:hypothetical protein
MLPMVLLEFFKKGMDNCHKSSAEITVNYIYLVMARKQLRNFMLKKQ